MFESNVIYIGTKTENNTIIEGHGFESNVIYIGTKTEINFKLMANGLRVM